MTINDTQDEIIAEFSDFDDWMDRYQLLIDLGSEQQPLDERYKTDQNLIEGCQSRVWRPHARRNPLGRPLLHRPHRPARAPLAHPQQRPARHGEADAHVCPGLQGERGEMTKHESAVVFSRASSHRRISNTPVPCTISILLPTALSQHRRPTPSAREKLHHQPIPSP